MNYWQACAFIDAWGQKPDEWFVCEANYREGIYGLSHDMAGRVERRVVASSLVYPNGAGGPRFYVGDPVRVRA